MSVHRLLVTGQWERLVKFQMVTASRMNWLESRSTKGSPDPDIVTALGTLFEADLEGVLALAGGQEFGEHLTVQEIEGAGESETYRLLSGEEARGWPSQ